MARFTKFFGVSAVLLVALTACGTDKTPAANPTTPSPSPAATTFTEDEWTIETPTGWTREVITADADAKKAVRYKHTDGRYFIVAIDPLGSDFAYDALWRYEAKGDRFEVVERYECAGKQDESCRDEDARYDGYVLWKSGSQPQKVGGHTWYFIFGNTKSTTVDLAAFETILETIRVTA